MYSGICRQLRTKKEERDMERHILLSSPTMHGDEMKYIEEAFDRNWIAPLGFEGEWEYAA